MPRPAFVLASVLMLLVCRTSVAASPTTLPADAPVANIAAMLAIESPADGQVLTVQSFATADGGGGGRFRYAAASTQPHDGGVVVAAGAPDPNDHLIEYLNWKSSAVAGRWIRIVPDSARVNARWFGAVGDGTRDDTAALNKAAAYFYTRKSHGTLYIPAGRYYVAGMLSLYPRVDFTGDGIGQTIIERRNPDNYLLGSGPGGTLEVSISRITFDNPQRLLLYRHISNISFSDVEFLSGMVRFENSEHIRIDHCVFRNNIGKAAYASSECRYVSITNNLIRDPAYGGLNLSGHSYCVVANNQILKETLTPSAPGYGGIRLPNSARFNTVTGNVVRNYPRGIFVLSGSTYNTISGNVVDGAALQGILVESDHNTFAQNILTHPGAECIRINGASDCVIVANQLSTTQPTVPALRLTGAGSMAASGNQLLNNLFEAPLGLNISPEDAARNVLSGNAPVTRKTPATVAPSAED
jgi:parallel beta-helix repeat protein